MKTKEDQNPESVVKEIKRRTRRKFSAEEKIRIILEGLKGEYCNYLSERRHDTEYVLQVEQGISGGGETSAER